MEKNECFNKAEVYCIEEVFVLLNISKDGLYYFFKLFFRQLEGYHLVLWPTKLEHKASTMQSTIILCLWVPPGVGSSAALPGRQGESRQPLLLAHFSTSLPAVKDWLIQISELVHFPLHYYYPFSHWPGIQHPGILPCHSLWFLSIPLRAPDPQSQGKGGHTSCLLNGVSHGMLNACGICRSPKPGCSLQRGGNAGLSSAFLQHQKKNLPFPHPPLPTPCSFYSD